MSTGWIYLLKKAELVAEAEKRGIPTEDSTVEQLRKLLAEEIKGTEGFKTPEERQLPSMENDDENGKTGQISKLIREWNISFETADNAVEFVERLEELIEASGVEKAEVLPVLPRILRGRALLWYRNNSSTWESWAEFLKLFKLYYFPNNYEEDLIVRIVARKQRFNESFRDYLTDLQTLMRRYGKLSEEEKLHRIHENMRREYKLYIKKQDYTGLGALLKLAAEYEDITPSRYGHHEGRYEAPYTDKAGPSAQGQWRQPAMKQSLAEIANSGRAEFTPRARHTYDDRAKEAKPVKVHPRYDPKTCCWACGKPGHDARECRSRSVLFCSGCGKMGVLSKNCCRADPRTKREYLGATDECNRQDNREYVEAEIMGTRYQCLVDTGSTNTYVSEEVYEDCRRKGALEKEIQRGIRLANNSDAQVYKSIVVTVCAKGAKVKHCVRLLPNATGVIIGMDLLKRVGLKLSWAGDDLEEQDIQKSEPDTPRQEIPQFSHTSAAVKTPEDEKQGEQTLTATQQSQLEGMLQEEYRLCEHSPKGNTWVEHKIKMKHKEPIKQKYFPRNPKQQQIIDAHVKEMLEQGIIERSSSPYSSPVVLVKKENGQHRFCIDFRRVNEASEKDAYPLPQIDDTLEKLRKAKFFSKFDLKNGYWNVPLEKASRPVTAFTAGRGLYQFKVMPFGLHSSGATFQRLLDRVIG